MSNDSTEIFAFPVIIGLIPVVVAVVSFVLGYLCFRRREIRRLSYFLFAVTVLAGGLFAPAILQDRIVVSATELSSTTGFWFSPTALKFTYKDVRTIRITTFKDPKGRVGTMWKVYHHDGSIQPIPLSDLWSRNADRIADLLKSHGVQFSKY